MCSLFRLFVQVLRPSFHVFVFLDLFTATAGLLFGVDLESVTNRENLSAGVPGVVPTAVSIATQSQVPLIIKRGGGDEREG